MANIWSGPISNQDYEKLETLAGTTFESGTTYVIQSDNDIIVREGTDGRGFLIDNGMPFQYTCGTEDLYIKCATPSKAFINIAG